MIWIYAGGMMAFMAVNGILALYLGERFVNTGEIERNRLFTKNVFARPCGSNHELRVCIREPHVTLQ